VSAADGLAALNGWIRARSVMRGWTPMVLCGHCDRVAEVGPDDPARCVVCDPGRSAAEARAWEVRSRHSRAVQVAKHRRRAA